MTNDLTVNNNNIINLVSGKNATLTSATAVGAQSIFNVSTIKCLKTGGNLSITLDATAITLTGGSNIPCLTTGKIIASAGTREGGAAWTGIIAMNTATQEVFYTDDARNIDFR